MAYQIVGAGVSARRTDVLQVMDTVATTATGDWYILPNGMTQIAIEVVPGTSAKIQHTLDIDGAIAGTAVGIDWDAGTVTVPTCQILYASGAVRLVSVSGTANGIIRGITP